MLWGLWMKRFCAVVVTLLLLLPGCAEFGGANKSTPPSAPAAFSTDLLVQFGGLELTAQCQQTAPGKLIIAVKTPERLAGMRFQLEDAQCTIQYQDMTFAAEPQDVPASAFASLLAAALQARQEDKLAGDLQGEIWKWEGTSSSVRFQLEQHAQTGVYLALRAPEVDAAITFHSFKVDAGA